MYLQIKCLKRSHFFVTILFFIICMGKANAQSIMYDSVKPSILYTHQPPPLPFTLNLPQLTKKDFNIQGPIFRREENIFKPTYYTPLYIEHTDTYLQNKYYNTRVGYNKVLW